MAVMTAVAPQGGTALDVKKPFGKVMVMELAWPASRGVTVEKAKVAAWPVAPAMRLDQGMDSETAYTCPLLARPMVPVAAKVVVQSLLVLTDTPQGALVKKVFNVRPQSVTV